jgi:hypothetical protein
MATRERIKIDIDLMHAAQKYVNEQLEVMENFGSAPILTAEQYGELVYNCAKPPQEIRNLTLKAERKTPLPGPTTKHTEGGS